jgi:dolichol kinase
MFKNGALDILRHSLSLIGILMMSIAAAFVGALSELVPIAKLDDNLTLPILSATGLFLIITILGNL